MAIEAGFAWLDPRRRSAGNLERRVDIPPSLYPHRPVTPRPAGKSLKSNQKHVAGSRAKATAPNAPGCWRLHLGYQDVDGRVGKDAIAGRWLIAAGSCAVARGIETRRAAEVDAALGGSLQEHRVNGDAAPGILPGASLSHRGAAQALSVPRGCHRPARRVPTCPDEACSPGLETSSRSRDRPSPLDQIVEQTDRRGAHQDDEQGRQDEHDHGDGEGGRQSGGLLLRLQHALLAILGRQHA